jgi:nucleoside-diphosphate-sugar epimerase
MTLKNRLLVTGAKGFVGSEMIRRLKGKYLITSLENDSGRIDRREKQFDDRREQNAFYEKVCKVDIIDREAILRLDKIGSIDAFVHVAGLAHQFGATKKERFQKVNVEGTGNVLELAARLNAKHFVLISSVSVYGLAKDKKNVGGGIGKPIDETAQCLPEDFYAQSKFDGENLSRVFCEKNRIKLTILRLATVIGEEDKGNLLNLIRAIDQRRFLWIGSGENHKSFVHRTDVARACEIVLDKAKPENMEPEIYNVAADFLKVREIVEITSRLLKKKIPPLRIPQNLVEFLLRTNAKFFKLRKLERAERTVVKWLADDVYSAEKLRRTYGFEPEIKAARAVEREIEWYLAQK